MTYVFYGALGMLAVLGLLLGGAALGWRARGAWQERTRQAAVKEATEEERRVLAEQQRAFEGMLNYSADQAYGMNKDLSELVGSDT